jgi:hypothetical protein
MNNEEYDSNEHRAHSLSRKLNVAGWHQRLDVVRVTVPANECWRGFAAHLSLDMAEAAVGGGVQCGWAWRCQHRPLFGCCAPSSFVRSPCTVRVPSVRCCHSCLAHPLFIVGQAPWAVSEYQDPAAMWSMQRWTGLVRCRCSHMERSWSQWAPFSVFETL